MHTTAAALALLALTGSPAAAEEGERTSLLSPVTPIAAPQVLGSPSVADDTFVKARAGAWLLFQSGSIRVGEDSGGGATTVLDFRDTLNQDETAFSPIGSVAFAIPAVDLLIEAGYLGSFAFDGSTTGQTISFDGETYTGTITSENAYDIYEANILYELTEISVFKIHVGGGVRAFDVESEITGTVSGSTQTERDSLFLPLPVAVVGARADLGPNFFVQGRLAGMVYGEYGNVLDGSLEVGYDFFRNLGVFAGYRVITADSEAFDVEFDLTLGGPYAGLELRI